MVFRLFGKKKKDDAPEGDDVPNEDENGEMPDAVMEDEPESLLPEEDAEEEEVAPEEDAPAGVPFVDLEETGSTGLFGKLKKGLTRTRDFFTTDVDDLFFGRKVDEALLEELEERLITSDIGVETALEIVERIREARGRIQDTSDLKTALVEELKREMDILDEELPEPATGFPHVILMVGVNGVGKTTTIGKLAARYRAEGKKVLLAAGDTFRAAAVEQLDRWADRVGCDIVKHKANTDPAAVAFDAIDAAIARKVDVVLIDTAGRLHNKVNLMEELKKIHRTIQKRLPDAPHETLLVVDATTGQNAIRQTELFDAAIGLTGLALTKLDGTAKGGIVLAIRKQFGFPIRYVGVGEGIDDLQPFDARDFLSALFDF